MESDAPSIRDRHVAVTRGVVPFIGERPSKCRLCKRPILPGVRSWKYQQIRICDWCVPRFLRRLTRNRQAFGHNKKQKVRPLMKPLVVALAFVLLSAISASAQTAGTVHYLTWSPNPPADNVIAYWVSLDGAPNVSVSPTVVPACSCIRWQLPTLANGTHVAVVSAQNAWSATAAPPFSFPVASPSAPSGFGIQ